MLNICLSFNESQSMYTYKRYAYQEKGCSCKVAHCVKSVRIRSFSGPHFPAFGLNTEVRMRENTDQKNSECGHFLSSGILMVYHFPL